MNANIIRQYRRIHNWENFFIDSAVYSVGQSAGIEYEDGFQPVAAVTGDLFAYMYSSEKPCDSGMTNYFFLPEAVEKAYSLFGYECIYLSNHAIQEDIDAALAQIRRSVDRGIPVFAWGCGGWRPRRLSRALFASAASSPSPISTPAARCARARRSPCSSGSRAGPGTCWRTAARRRTCAYSS